MRRIWIGVAAVAVVAFGAAFQFLNHSSPASQTYAPSAAAYVGSETCAGCHQAEAKLWGASQHKAAMQHATDQTVLGNFNDASFDYYGVRSRFFRKDGKFLVETDGADGKLAVFELKYTFGVDPLQQYLVEFPDGRIQALPIAWDSRSHDKGGQRWLHLSPDEAIKHDDILHWTKLNQNWNFMCAECHSTGLRKNYDAATDRFATTWADISVGCEACHGQGSNHTNWAREQQSWWPFGKRQEPGKGLLVRFDERQGVAWPIDPQTGNARRSAAPAMLRKEVETCGLCHARRAGFRQDWIPGEWLSQTHVVEPLARNTYHADGQIRDVEEPYNYTPFKQGKMFAAGVTCSDCHEPHSAKLRLQGEGTCLQCHASDKYADVKHSHHAEADPAPTCISCHMPARTYMVVDVRHDHAFRVPRPDLSVSLGTPNACNDCHRDKAAQWAAAAIERWFGPARKGFQTYGQAFHAARTGQSDAAELLSVLSADRLAPAVARASALGELASRVTPASIAAARTALTDPDPMVRIGGLAMLENVAASQIWPLASPLLADPVRGVRIRAASLLASVPTASQPSGDRASFDQAAGEFVTAQRANAERPEARAALADFLARRGQTGDAEMEYRAALRLSPQYATAAINLADLYRRTGRESDGETVLRGAIAASPGDAAVHHALGLALTRLKRPDEALAELRRATELDPDSPRYVYVYAVALHSGGQADEAMKILNRALERHPGDRDVLSALVSFSRAAGDARAALDYAERLAIIVPDDRNLAALIAQIKRQIGAPSEATRPRH
ncbi:tetratricopeptide repeat protein [Bradyrhizobium symbiodeficiens]|uniref:Tetratricopeptide repeat protein n=1 Tax=Bradyrhizobium symbiodeficiens TaxID=1404367 RepID=A0ABX5W3L6_9BRAD|nr:tetratricopeptide repeat protein [Bradyrhizobium symbiodeficiens]QDF37812.1 tetratricopeptide repeat protein [Bradyrhizobium symbiodeficiens]